MWNDATRSEVRARFLATGTPYADDSFARVDGALRVRVAAWEQARQESCEATEIRHEQSSALMDARMACLARAREEIAAFVDRLRGAGARDLPRAISAAASVGDLEPCAQVATLTAAAPAPRDPRAAAAVAELERELAGFGAIVLLGRMKEAQAAGPALVERARALDHQPLLARVLFQSSTPGCEAGDPRDGAAALYQAARAAAAAHDDVLAAKIAIKLVFCVGARDENLAAAQTLVETAEAALARIGSPLDLRGRLYREEARVQRHAGDLVTAFGFAELALMTYQRRYGEDSAEAAPSMGDLGDILTALGGYTAARAAYGRALPILERARGPNHPIVATYLSNLGIAEIEVGDLDAAAGDFVRAIAIWESSGPDQAGVPSILRNLAEVRERQGQLEVAAQLALRARAIDEKTRRPDHPSFARTMVIQASLALDRGDVAEAQRLADQARAVFVKTFGAGHALVADVGLLRARIARKRHELARARELVEEALAIHRKGLGPRHPTLASDESELAAILLELGEARAAVSLLEGALAVQERARGEGASEVVVARTLLSEALRATGDSARAIELAERAVAAASERRMRADLDGRARFALAQALGTVQRTRALQLGREARARLAGSPAADEVPRVDRWLAGR